MSERKFSYDPACESLAEHFLPRNAPTPLKQELAQCIQESVEAWLETSGPGEVPGEIPGKLEFYEGKLRPVLDASRSGWWRFHQHYDRDGYCDNPARGY